MANSKKKKHVHMENIQLDAAALTFHSVIAIVPVLAIGIWFVSQLPASYLQVARVEQLLVGIIVPDFAKSISQILQTLLKQASVLSLASIPLLVFACISLIHNLEKSLNRIFHAPQRNWKRKLLFMLIALLFCPILLLAVLAVSEFTNAFDIGWLRAYDYTLTQVVAEIILFSAIYRLMPTVAPSTLLSLLGGSAAVFCLYWVREAFQGLLVGLGSYELLYGVFAALPLFFLWVYSFWTTIFLLASLLYWAQVMTQSGTER